MVRTFSEYVVPLKGTIINWKSFEGDGNVGAAVIGDIIIAWDGGGLPDEDKQVTTYLRSIDIDSGSCIIDVEAHTLLHTLIVATLASKSIDTLASEYRITHLKIPPEAPRPEKELVFNRRSST